MKLTELFPVDSKITLGGKEYELIYNTRAVLQLERDYPDIKDGDKVIEAPQRINKITASMLTGVSATDLINVLFALLLSSKAFLNKDALVDLLEISKFDEYCSAAWVAIVNARITDEQREKLEVLAAQAKKKALGEIMGQSTASTDASADLAEKTISTPPSES